MPIVYRPRPQTFDHSTPTQQHSIPVPTDADDSIVLSDIVRQGEASRLRRRGAMRLEHAPLVAQSAAPLLDPADALVGSPPSESEPEPDPADGPVFARNTSADRQRTNRSGYGYGGGRARTRADAFEDSDDVSYTLFCGGEESDGEGDVDTYQMPMATRPYEPSILPLYPSTEYTKASSSTTPLLPRNSSGCGALLHMNASPRRRLGVFTAKNEASTGAVIPLDAAYFDRSAMAKIVRSACGCVREGIGCAVCGKPLGMRYKPCKTASDGIFNSRPNGRQNPSAFSPEGSRYWHAQSHTRAASSTSAPSDQSGPHSKINASSFFVYTFFSTSVSSSPAYAFPPRAAQNNNLSPELQPQPLPLRPEYQSPPDLEPLPPYQPQFRPRYQFQRVQTAQTVRTVPSPFPRLRPAAALGVNVDGNDSDNDDTDDNSSLPQISITVDSQSEGPDTPVLSSENPVTATVMFDRVMTASPTSLSDIGDGAPSNIETREQIRPDSRGEGYARYQPDAADEFYRDLGTYRYGPVFNADGEFVGEPDSPDKTSDVMLLPER